MATLAEVGKHLDTDPRKVKDLVDRGILTKCGRGQYDLEQARQEYLAYIREVAAGRFKSGELDLQAERARLAKEQADAKEMENAVERGDLVYIEDVAKQVENQLTKVRTRLLAVPTKVAPEAHASATVREVQAVVEVAIVEALNELVGYSEGEAVQDA